MSPPAGSLQNPCFSPDGTWIAFTQWRRAYNEGLADVHVVPLAGGRSSRVSRRGAASVNMPGTCWSATIAFEARRGDPDGSPGTRLWTIPAPGP